MNIIRIGLFGFFFLIMTGCSSKTFVRAENGQQVKVECQPIYGSWCGKGYPSYEVTGVKPKPVDIWDEACMEHDLCYDKYGENGEEMCDRKFSNKLEDIHILGIPVPHQIQNAYNVFKEDMIYRAINISFKDIWNANTVSCDGKEGIPALFCDVRMGPYNCEISMGMEWYGEKCFCRYPPFYPPLLTPSGYFYGGITLYGTQRTANDF